MANGKSFVNGWMPPEEPFKWGLKLDVSRIFWRRSLAVTSVWTRDVWRPRESDMAPTIA